MTHLQNVNTTDLRAAIELGCRTMQNIFDADDNFTPFFISTVGPYVELSFSPNLSECHVPGRHLNALLMAEAVAGMPIDPQAIAHHRRAAFFSFAGPLRVNLNREKQDGPHAIFSAHNLREGLHALYALTKYRHDAEAHALAEAFIAEVNRLWSPERGLDEDRFRALGLTFQPCQGPVNGETRMIGPLVKYYRATGSPAALDLAIRLKDDALKYFPLDGAYDRAHTVTDHTHSITGSLSSLAQLADLLDDMALLHRVKAFYDNGLWDMRDEIGWSPGAVYHRETDNGEGGNVGDMVEAALILGAHGYPEYYADAERILRCHLLPSQLRDVSFMRDNPHPTRDGQRNAADRHLGAFGLAAPYGHLSTGKGLDSIGFYMDVVGSVVGSICAAYADVARWDEAGHRVNMLFDYDTDAITIESPYTHHHLRVTLKRPGSLWVRLPSWVTPNEVVAEHAPLFTGGYLFFAQPPLHTPITIQFPLKETTLTLSARVHPHPIRVRLRGDSVLAMDNRGADLTFFESYE